MQRHHDSLNEQLLELRVQVQQLGKDFFPSFPGVFVIQVLKAEMASGSSWWYELCPNDLLLQLYVNYDIFLLKIN